MTQNCFEKCTYMVRKSEAPMYKANGVENIWEVDDELINSGSKAYFYIINNAPDDVIVIADDDIADFQYMLDTVRPIGDNKEVITDEIYRIAQLVYDLKVGFAFISPNCIPYEYDKEFGFYGIPGSVKWINRTVFKAKLDPKVSENFDIDLVLQELLVNRICLYPKYLHDKGGKKDVTSGGNSDRKRQAQLDSLHNMRIKWGRYFKYDQNKNKPKINVER